MFPSCHRRDLPEDLAAVRSNAVMRPYGGFDDRKPSDAEPPHRPRLRLRRAGRSSASAGRPAAPPRQILRRVVGSPLPARRRSSLSSAGPACASASAAPGPAARGAPHPTADVREIGMRGIARRDAELARTVFE